MTMEYNGYDPRNGRFSGVWKDIGLKNSTEGFRESGKGRLRALCSLAVGFPPERGSSSYSGAPARPTAQFTFLK